MRQKSLDVKGRARVIHLEGSSWPQKGRLVLKIKKAPQIAGRPRMFAGQTRTCSRGTGYKPRDGTGLPGPSRKFRARVGSDRLSSASDLRNGLSHLRPRAPWSTR